MAKHRFIHGFRSSMVLEYSDAHVIVCYAYGTHVGHFAALLTPGLGHLQVLWHASRLRLLLLRSKRPMLSLSNVNEVLFLDKPQVYAP